MDAVTFRFSDLLGRKTVSNQNFRDGITPYIWKYGDKIEWYVYKPIKADYDQISEWEFLVVIRLRADKESEVFPYLNRIEKTLREQSFSVIRADKEDIKRILAVYFEQNVTTEKFEDFDGEPWIVLND